MGSSCGCDLKVSDPRTSSSADDDQSSQHEVMDLPHFHNIRTVCRKTLCSWDTLTSEVKLAPQQEQPQQQPDEEEEQDLVSLTSSSTTSSEASFYKVWEAQVIDGVEMEKPCSAQTNGRFGLSILRQLE
eukprot:PhF_6_TR4183/c0_g1_i2/m.5623